MKSFFNTWWHIFIGVFFAAVVGDVVYGSYVLGERAGQKQANDMLKTRIKELENKADFKPLSSLEPTICYRGLSSKYLYFTEVKFSNGQQLRMTNQCFDKFRNVMGKMEDEK